MNLLNNLILNADSYKCSHYCQYPPGTETVSSYIESRGGEFDRVLFFGLQLFLKQYLLKPITQADIDEAEALIVAHGLPFYRQGWQRIVDRHGGLLPLAIEAVAEGTLLPVSNAMLQVHNTDPACYWLTSYIETALLRAIWYPSTVATISWHAKQIIKRYLEQTAGDCSGLDFKLHDFGARGVSSLESAALGACAHLVNFKGSDTMAGFVAARQYYGESMAAVSIPAAEHATITSWGQDKESAAYAHLLQQFNAGGSALSIVSDSYDLWSALADIFGGELKQQVQQFPGVLVIRPDSGDPVEVVTKTIACLIEKFGSKINSKGYQVLPDNIRVIQGDGVDLHSIEACLQSLKQHGFSADNVAFGMGGALLQKCHRDTQRFAMKASAICCNGEWRDVYKQPKTDTAKASKRGRLALLKNGDDFETIRRELLQSRTNALLPLYRDGELLQECSFASVRANASLLSSK